MKKITGLMTVFALAAVMVASADVVWTGGGNTADFYDNANWDFSGSTQTTNPPAGGAGSPTLQDNYTMTGATILETVSGGFSNIEVGAGNTVLMDNTSFIFQNANGFNTLGTLSLVNGAFHDAQFVALTTTVDATSTLRLRGAGSAIGTGGTVNLVTGAKLDFAAASRWSDAVQTSRIFVNGTQYSVGDTSLITVDGNIGTAIPEPATLGMLALFGGGMVFIRRKFRN